MRHPLSKIILAAIVVACTAGCATVSPGEIENILGELAVVSSKLQQTAGGDVNDTWTFRMLALTNGPLALLGYMGVVRPLRKWWERNGS